MVVELILAIMFIAISLVWMYIGIFDLGIWIPGVKAQGGLIPTVFAALTLIFSILMLIQAFKKKPAEEKKVEKKEPKSEVLKLVQTFLPVIFGVVGIFVFEYFGVVIFTFLMSFLWLILLSKKKWTFSLLVACILTLFIYLVFEMWLKIPFPGRIIRL